MGFLKRLFRWPADDIREWCDCPDCMHSYKFVMLTLDEVATVQDKKHLTKSCVEDQIYRYMTCLQRGMANNDEDAITVTAVALAAYALIATVNWGDVDGRS